MKYYLSLCCIIKNEKYLEQFIVYYHVLGVEHFYIYDNDSSPRISDRLNNNYFKNLCTIIPFSGKMKQLPAYNDCINITKNETKWLVVVDGDEYIYPKQDFSLRDFISKYDNYHAVGINWVFFGSSFHEKSQDGILIDKFRHCNKNQNEHIKTICQPRFTISFRDPHCVNLQNPSKYTDPNYNIISGPYNKNHTIDKIQINHYHLKSREDLHRKKELGSTPDRLERYKGPDDAVLHQLDNDIIDNDICDKYLEHIKRYIQENNIKLHL